MDKCNGYTKVKINDVLVNEQQLRTTRQYNQINLSDYSYLLQSGKNTLEVEVEMASGARAANMNFDFGLTGF